MLGRVVVPTMHRVDVELQRGHWKRTVPVTATPTALASMLQSRFRISGPVSGRLGTVITSTLLVWQIVGLALSTAFWGLHPLSSFQVPKQPFDWWLADVIQPSESSEVCRRRLRDEIILQAAVANTSFAEEIDDFEELGLDDDHNENIEGTTLFRTRKHRRFCPHKFSVLALIFGRCFGILLALIPALRRWWKRKKKACKDTTTSISSQQQTTIQSVLSKSDDDEFGPPVFATEDNEDSCELRSKQMLQGFVEIGTFSFEDIDPKSAYERLWSDPLFYTSFLDAENEQPKVQDWITSDDGLLRRRVDCRHPLGVPLPRWCGLRGLAIPTVKRQVALAPRLIVETSNFEGFPFATSFHVQTAWLLTNGSEPHTTSCAVYTRCGFEELVPTWVRNVVTNKSKDEILIVNKRMALLARTTLAQSSKLQQLPSISAPARAAYPPLPAGRALDDFLQMRDDNDMDDVDDDRTFDSPEPSSLPKTPAVAETAVSSSR